MVHAAYNYKDCLWIKAEDMNGRRVTEELVRRMMNGVIISADELITYRIGKEFDETSLDGADISTALYAFKLMNGGGYTSIVSSNLFRVSIMVLPKTPFNFDNIFEVGQEVMIVGQNFEFGGRTTAISCSTNTSYKVYRGNGGLLGVDPNTYYVAGQDKESNTTLLKKTKSEHEVPFRIHTGLVCNKSLMAIMVE